MTKAKLECPSKKYFERIKESINIMNYTECGLCGAILIDVKDLESILDSLISKYEKNDEYFSDLCSDILSAITMAEFYDEDDEEPSNYLDEIIIFHDVNCDCFGKEKIKEEIVVN
ncbi:MAG: hypothetical protein ACLPSL_13010 [Smithella sp.]